MKIYYWLVLLLIVITSCSEASDKYTDSLICETEHLSSKVLNDSFVLAAPKRMHLLDSLLLILDTRCGENLFYVFSANTGAFLKGGGKRGEAPGEVLSPGNAHLNNKGMLCYWDMYKNKLVQYDVHRLISNSPECDELPVLRQQTETSYLDVISLSDGCLYNGNTDRHIGFVNQESYLDVLDLPQMPSMEICRAVMNQSHLAVSPNGKKVIQASKIGGILQCYSINRNRINKSWSKLYFPPIYKLVEGVKPAWITWCEDSRMGFDNLYVTDDFIYLLLNGKIAKDKPFSDELLILNWRGELCRKFKLDRTVKTIAVDEEKKMIYATTCGFDTEPYIVTFHF